jgi:hypothetical protein
VDTNYTQNSDGVPYFLRFEDAVGSFAWRYFKYNEGILYNLSDFDKDYYSHLRLKNGEKLFRYSTDRMIDGSKYLIKINLLKGLIYFMSEQNDMNDDKNISFETRGIKAEYITLDKDKVDNVFEKYATGGSVDRKIYIAFYDDYEKSYGYVIEKNANSNILYWNGEKFTEKYDAKTYKTKSIAERELKNIKNKANRMEDGGRVWTKEQREKVAKLDKEFIEYVKEKGIQRNSYEASLLWREGGFKKRMGEIFGKEYGKYAKGGYTRPSYKINTTGFFSFKTKDKEYIVRSSFFERKNDIEDSLQIQDELRGELGSIIITNSAWKRLSDGNTIKARSNRGNLTGTLTRVANLNENYSLNKMANGGGVEEWTNNLKYLTSKKVYFDINSGKIYPKINYKPNMSKGKNVDEFGNKWFDSLNDRDLSTIQIYLNNRKSMAKGGGLIRKAPFKVGDMVYSYQNPNHKMRVAFVEDRGIEDGVDYGWGIRVALKTDANGNYDPNGSYSKTSKYMSQNSVSKTKKDSYSTGGMVEFYDYKGIEIMYEPTYKEYYANDMVFYSLEDAHEYIDSGEANKTPKHIENLYRRGAMAKGGNVGSQDLYKLAEEMSEKDFRNKFLTLSKSEKDNVESLIRLGDDKKLALITILDKRNEPNNDDFYRQAYHYKKGGSVNKKVYIDLFED